MAQLEISNRCPQDFIVAIWEEFFVARHRGTSISVNLGWLLQMTGFYVGLRQNGKLIAGLIMRRCHANEYKRDVAAIGFVWVAVDQRGLGYSTLLLEHTIALARKEMLHDLLLWTGKPRVYEKMGFISQDNGLIGDVRCERLLRVRSVELHRECWPNRDDTRGLPAFASAGHVWRSEVASVTTLETAGGPILAEWEGNDTNVAEILCACMGRAWRLNALTGDTLPEVLAENGWNVEITSTRLRMILSLQGGAPEPETYRLRLLDRI